jgi:hypothetical protein
MAGPTASQRLPQRLFLPNRQEVTNWSLQGQRGRTRGIVYPKAHGSLSALLHGGTVPPLLKATMQRPAPPPWGIVTQSLGLNRLPM